LADRQGTINVAWTEERKRLLNSWQLERCCVGASSNGEFSGQDATGFQDPLELEDNTESESGDSNNGSEESMDEQEME
jgi:hypothetical protein